MEEENRVKRILEGIDKQLREKEQWNEGGRVVGEQERGRREGREEKKEARRKKEGEERRRGNKNS